MNILLPKLKLFFSLFFLFVISEKVFTQCTITGSSVVNANTLTCGTAPLSACNGFLYIGDGVTATSLYMNAALNLTCLGPIQLVVRNKGALDFSAGNDYLTLAEGSSVIFEAGGSLIGGSCNASERLYIGTNLLASCNGGAGADLSFTDLVSLGGTGSATSNSPVCVGNNIVLSATPPPSGTFTYQWNGPNSFTSTLQNPTPFPATTTPNTAGIYTVSIKRISDGKTIDAYTTVVVNTGTLPSAPTVSLVQPTCSVATGTISVLTPVPDGVVKYSINSLTYTNTTGTFNLVSSGTYSVTAKNSSGCISPALTTMINAQPVIPSAPTGVASQSFCSGASPTVANLSATGTGIQWYVASSGGSALAPSTALTNGNHYYASQTANGCESTARFDVLATVNTTPLAPTGTALQSFCSGASPTVANLSATGSSIQWYAVSSGGSALASSTALTNGNHYYASQTANGCESTSRFDVTVNINTVPTAPVLATTLSLSCSATGFTVNWSASVNAINYNIDVATDAVFVTILPSYNNLALGNVLSLNVIGLTAGSSYYVRLRATNSCGTSTNSNTMVVSVPTTTYSGLWDNGLPDSTKKIIFASNYSITSPLSACSCQINSGVNIVVGVPGGLNDMAVLKIENGLDVLGSGTLTFENNSSLVQVNKSGVNTGSIIYKRISSPMKNFDYTYWSSPVKNQVLNVLSPNTLYNKYFSWASSWVIENGSNTMNPAGKGFIIRVPKPNVTYPNGEYWTGATYAQPVQFVGVPYNGDITIPTQGAGQYNLIGNPYPSAIDADLFMEDADNGLVLSSGLYFWTHNTAITQSGSQYIYSSNDYAIYTLTGSISAISGGSPPSGQIAAGQSFFVQSKATGNFVFNNSMRISNSGANSQFFKIGKTKKAATTEKNRVWLSLTNSGGAFKQILVGYMTGATNDFDNLYDGVSLNGNAYIDFYSINSSKNLTIQGRALPFDLTDQVPLGYKTSIAGTFEISINKADGVLANQGIFIEDKVAGIIVDLKKGSYSFSTAIGTYNDRFVLRYTDNSLKKTGLSDVKSNSVNQSVTVLAKNHQIKINSSDQILNKVMIYDLNGRLLFKKENVNSKEFTISEFNFSEQFLVVLVQFANEEWVTKEIMFE